MALHGSEMWVPADQEQLQGGEADVAEAEKKTSRRRIILGERKARSLRQALAEARTTGATWTEQAQKRRHAWAGHEARGSAGPWAKALLKWRGPRWREEERRSRSWQEEPGRFPRWEDDFVKELGVAWKDEAQNRDRWRARPPFTGVTR